MEYNRVTMHRPKQSSGNEVITNSLSALRETVHAINANDVTGVKFIVVVKIIVV